MGAHTWICYADREQLAEHLGDHLSRGGADWDIVKRSAGHRKLNKNGR